MSSEAYLQLPMILPVFLCLAFEVSSGEYGNDCAS